MNLKEALDSANYICVLSTAPFAAAYGPYSPDEAFEFCTHYNDWLNEHGFEGQWVAVPVLPRNGGSTND